MRLRKLVILISLFLPCGSTVAQKSDSPRDAETPDAFMTRTLRLADGNDRNLVLLDSSDTIYSLEFLDAMFGKGCFTEKRACVVDHLLAARVCGCHRFTEDLQKTHDPICGCPDKVTFSELKVVHADNKSADVSALLDLETHKKYVVKWRLIMTQNGWRIDDVGTEDIPSMKAEFAH